MRNLDEINVLEIFDYIKELYGKTTKKQRIIFVVVIVLLIFGYLFGKNIWERYSILKQAENIVTEISKSENDFLEKDGKYKKDIFTDQRLIRVLSISSYRTDDSLGASSFSSSRRRNNMSEGDFDEEPNLAQSGDFYIEVDAENACLVLKYKRNTLDKTIYYASFTDPKILCQGKKCFKQAKNENEDLCYANSSCFPARLTFPEEQSCGDNKGLQTRKCHPSCNGGACEEWSECVCKKGFEWDGKTCKQSQTEEDCTEDQCFNGIYCEDREVLTKNIENGSCQRVASCQKNVGWIYASWNCSCNSDSFCSLKETCVARPSDQAKIDLPDEEGNCEKVYYTCKEGEGWVQKANNCNCDKPGFFWDMVNKETKCSPCTKKPEGAMFISSGKYKDNCDWKCEEGYQERKGVCVKPDGQYLCARMELQICTDDFSKNRKIQKDAKKTNEKQPCFLEDKDNILFYNQKEKSCILCQCFDLNNTKANN